jgi:vacuolar-type H+-ATPase subunit H
MKTIINCETGKATTRELNAEELAQQAIDEATAQAEEAARQAEAAAKEAQRQALLDKLGITADEAKLLLG